MAMIVKFQPANAKVKRLADQIAVETGKRPHIYGFSLPAGWACPGARDCLSKAHRQSGKLKDGPETEFRCFMATMESYQPSLRASVWQNFDQLKAAKTAERMADILDAAIPDNANMIRVNVDGDFFNQAYFDAWLLLARKHPDITMYAYTKSLPYWVNRLGDIPLNFRLTASYGGRHDHLIERHRLKFAKVISHPSEAGDLEIDHDETHAAIGTKSFALLLHGQQPKGSTAGAALKLMASQGIEYAYSQNSNSK